MKKTCFSMVLAFLFILLGCNFVFALDTTEDFEGWGFGDGTPALSGGVYTYNPWRFEAKIDGVNANDGAIETWTGPAALSISTGSGQVDELRILNVNGNEFNFGGFNFTGSSDHSMIVTGWRDGVKVTEEQSITYTSSTADVYFDMRSTDPEFKNIDEIRICGADLGGGNYDVISGYLESLTYDTDPIDEVPPIVSTLTMTSNNANAATVARAGDTITLNITANEAIQSPTVTLANNNATISDAGDSDERTWKATYIMQEGDSSGVVPFTLDFCDKAGNAATQVTAVTVGSSVTFDKIAPTAPTEVTVMPVGGTVIANSLNKSNTNMTATATITATEATGGKAEIYVDGTLLATDNTIAATDTQVTFDLGKSTTAELQAAVASGGIVSIKLYDMVGNSSMSSAGNPTLIVDYLSEPPAPPTATVQAITGMLQVGGTLTGHYTYSDVNGDAEGTSTFKWYRADDPSGLNKTEIAGETAITYVLQSADIGKYISFEVTPVASTGTAQGTEVLSAWAGAVAPAEAPPTATVQAITGMLQVGGTLTGHYTYSDVNGDAEGTSTFKWYRADDPSGLNKTEIAGATAITYVLQAADTGKYICFEVTPVAATGTAQGTAVSSAWTGAIVPAEAAPTATMEAITGTLQVGETLTGNYNYSDVNGDAEGASTFKWYGADNASGLNKTGIAGATAITYVLQAADTGKYISFEVTPVAATGTAQGTAVSSAWTGAIVPAEAAPTATMEAITGTLQVGETLTGNYNYSDVNGDAEGTSTFKWYRADNSSGLNKSVIAGATALTYTLQSADADKYISFEVTPVAQTGTSPGTAVESEKVGAIVGDTTAPTGYSVAINQTSINNSNKTAMSFTFGGAEVGAAYNYVASSSGGGVSVTGSGTVTAGNQQITGIDVSALGDGTITLSVALTDSNGNIGTAATDTVMKEATAPTGYSVDIDQADINNSNKTAMSFSFGGAEVGATYNYVVSSSAGAGTLTGSGTITGVSEQITGIDVSTLGDGTITLSVTLTDSNGNIGNAATDTVIKDTIVQAAPTATVQPITGILQVGRTLTGNYTYSDDNGDLEGTSAFKWYRSDDATGLNKAAIAGATSITYVLQSADIGKYISFEVTPVAATGTAQGTAAESTKSGPVAPVSSGGSSGGSGSNTTTQPSQGTSQNTVVVVNGKEQYAGKKTQKTEDGKSTVTVAVDNKAVESKIDDAIKTNTTGIGNVIQVPVADTKSEVAKVELTGDIVKKLEENTFDVSVKRDNVEYVIPAEEFTISKVAENLGLEEKKLADIKVEVKITKLDEKVVEKYNEVAKANSAELVFPPVQFEIVAKTTNTDGTTKEQSINKFSNYVERVMEIPSGVDPSKITTGVVFNADGTYSHVPTEVYQKNGKWYARLNSMTNSDYSVIWNPVTVKSVEHHWAKDAVNDMASRLVVFNAESFEPDKAITRADFAEYIVRALGLYREGSKHENNFKDVTATDARILGILIANEYGIVSGYADGTFRGDNQITREEAMAMYQRAMKITNLVGNDENRYQNYTDFAQVGDWAKTNVKNVFSAHVFNGTTAVTISPKANLTYAEAAQAIRNLLVESKLINR